MSDKQVRVNVSVAINKAAIRKERRNGRDVIIVPSATMPDDVVMNRIKYPKDEIAKSFGSLNRKPAPLGHPYRNGQFISASDPEGLNISYIGAWNENVKRENGRVFIDKVIDVEFAKQSNGGKALLEAIDKGDPIHTSTGLLCMLEPVSNDEKVDFIAHDIEFDHDAILMGESGAATPDQGVGMLVNGQKVEVINSALDEAERELDWAGMHLIRTLGRIEEATAWEKMKAAILKLMGGGDPDVKPKENDMNDVTKEMFDQLSAKVNALAEPLTEAKVNELVTNSVTAAIKPLTDAMAATNAAAKAKEDADKAALVANIVKAALLTEAVANSLTLDALRELEKTIKPAKAFGLNAAFASTNKDDGFGTYDPNSAIDEAVKGVH